MARTTTFQSLNQTALRQVAQAILDNAEVVIRLWPDGEIADVQLSQDLPQVDVKDLLGRPIEDIAVADDLPTMDRILQAARAGKTSNPVELRHSALIGEGTQGKYSVHLAADGKNLILIGKVGSTAVRSAERATEVEIAKLCARARKT